MSKESAILVHQSRTPEDGVAVELAPEDVLVLRGVTLTMLQEAELRLMSSPVRTKQMFEDAQRLRDMVGEYGWHEA